MNGKTMFFAIDAIKEGEIARFLMYLKSLGDSTATYHFSDEIDAHYFRVSTKFVLEKVLPIFQETVSQQTKLNNRRSWAANTLENMAMELIAALFDFKIYFTNEKKFRRYSLQEQNSLLSVIDILKSSIIKQVLGKNTARSVMEYSQLLYRHCVYLRMDKQEDKIRNLIKGLNKYCNSIRSSRLCFLPQAVNPGYPSTKALARAASHLQILSKSQLGLPDEIQALIAAFRANYKRGCCHFGVGGELLYPSNGSPKEHATIENDERRVFNFFKSLSGHGYEKKKTEFLEYQVEESTKWQKSR
ncbi:Uncharacterised protein [Legionella hackeliae]|uniref:Uncharacterized protein n=2 Tax=Legionella hackeliae TaxID=449 RepID=A0A0A8URF0_LEGHA|nr:hypothetical protein Lhac_0898 [Legionella hackeliae]CEK09359.1 protein of unknown function [Legionella hackeliae]STX49267.1 Uncharacterised protein [Legionella hackeliae]